VADKPTPEALAADAATLDPKKIADVEKAIQQLTPEEATHFLALIERALKRRRIQFAGYMVSLVVLITTMTGALLYVGASPKGAFVGWAFFIPFLAVGAIFWIFGRWANRYK
jgi:hypothetical protein